MAVNRAQILSGHFGGSSSVVVGCNEANGTNILLYKYVNDTPVLTGSGLLGNDTALGAGKTRINLTSNIAAGNILVAYVVEIGRQGGDPITVYQDDTGFLTGWLEPDMVFGTDGQTSSYDGYLEAGGKQIAAKYSPQSTINNSVPRNGGGSMQLTDGTVIIAYTPGTPNGSATVSVGNFNNAIGNPRIKWDGGPYESVYQKVFTSAQNGTHTLEIFPESANFQSKLITFSINVIDGGTPPVTTAIWSAGYEINPSSSRQASLIAFSDSPLEARIKGIPPQVGSVDDWIAMSGSTGAKWNMAPYLNVATGTYIGEVRRIGTTEVYTVDVRIKF